MLNAMWSVRGVMGTPTMSVMSVSKWGGGGSLEGLGLGG